MTANGAVSRCSVIGRIRSRLRPGAAYARVAFHAGAGATRFMRVPASIRGRVQEGAYGGKAASRARCVAPQKCQSKFAPGRSTCRP